MIYGYERSRRPMWTYAFIGVCVAMFITQQITEDWVYLAFFPVLAADAPWTFLTSIFLHADISHLFFNMLALFFFGSSLERRIGGRALAVLFLASGIIGNIGYMITSVDPTIPVIGASGAIYGVMGALAVLAPLMMVFIYGMIPIPMILAAAVWGFLDFISLTSPSGIAYGAHLGGLFAGVLVGVYFRFLSRRYAVRY